MVFSPRTRPVVRLRQSLSGILFLGLLTAASGTVRAAELTPESAEQALRKATAFFREHVSTQGGYLWRYALDLQDREGENAASATTIWVQPPGTPTVGQAFLDAARRLSGDPALAETHAVLLAAARDAAEALIQGQLRSGGWDYRIEFDPDDRKRYAYRVSKHPGSRNTTTLDDNTTQSALRFLMRLDHTLEFQDARLHEAVVYGLNALLKAQYPNGAWPQRYAEFPDPVEFPVKEASYPDEWSRTDPGRDYRRDYTTNDNTLADMITTMFDAAAVYEDDRFRQSAIRGGEFILLAQMPDPQPAWAQQYDAQMHPSWARKFEPPAVTGGESQGVMRILMDIYRHTGEERFLEPIPRALDYLRASRRDDGRLARFYELRTNRPLYFTKQYELTYDDSDMPTHYAFIVGSNLESIERQYRQLREERRRPAHPLALRPARDSRALRDRAAAVVSALNERGAWVSDEGLRQYEGHEQSIETRTFCQNLQLLADFLASRP